MYRSITKETASVQLKSKTAALLTTILCAVLLPQLIHLCAIYSGTGKALGEALLPMHLPIMVVGYISGPVVGTIAGLLSPVISYLLTGMPSSAILPFMCIELMSYGMISGIIRGTKLPAVLKVLCIQAGGRMLRIAAILVCSYIFCIRTVSISSYIDTIGRGTIGIIIQLCLISALALITKKKEQK